MGGQDGEECGRRHKKSAGSGHLDSVMGRGFNHVLQGSKKKKMFFQGKWIKSGAKLVRQLGQEC